MRGSDWNCVLNFISGENFFRPILDVDRPDYQKVVKETVKVILKPALILIGLAILAVWIGILDETVVGGAFEWIGDRLLAGIEGISSWVADSWEARTGNG